MFGLRAPVITISVILDVIIIKVIIVVCIIRDVARDNLIEVSGAVAEIGGHIFYSDCGFYDGGRGSIHGGESR